MRIKVSLVLVTLALTSPPVFAQGVDSEVSANFTGNFQNQTSGMAVMDSPSYAGGLLVNYRYHFNRWSAIEANYGYTRFSQTYSSGSVTQANAHELSLAYQFTFGVASDAHFRPLLEAGTGALLFSGPITAGSTGGGLAQGRPTFLYGGGLAYKLRGPPGVQLGYRGLVYKTPDFTVPTQLTNATSHMAEPYVGLTFRF
jgi:opacity protein-like surface antigen